MSHLFETTSIKSITLKNRFVRSATWLGMAGEDGSCTLELIEHTVALARGNVGLIISGFAYVHKQGQTAKGQMGIYSDDLIPGLEDLTDKVHEADGKIVLQLTHGGVHCNPERTGCEVVGASVLTEGDDPKGREMTAEEIQDTVAGFQEGAIRAVKAGFDGIQIHAAHGFLLSQFLSPIYNKRRDKFGGSLENRARVLLDVVQTVREATGDDFPILIKINSYDSKNEGFTVEEMLRVSKWLAESGINAIEASGGMMIGWTVNNPDIFFSPTDMKGVYYEEAARHLKKAVPLPLILVGGIRSLGESQRLIAEGTADYVSLCRPLIREPNLVKRWENGETEEAECISCNGCFQPGTEGRGVYCIHTRGYRRKGGMLRFFAATSGAVNTKRAVAECLEKALGEKNLECDLIIFYTSMGHNFEDILSEAHSICPSAQIVGATCAGVIGREGPNESMRALGIMAIKGPRDGFALACTESMVGISPHDAGMRIADDLKSQNPNVNMILFHPSATNVMPADELIAGIESVFGPEVPIFGGASFDNNKLVTDFQFLGNRIFENGAVAVGFADPSLELVSQANHGFSVLENPFTVTRSEAARIYELDGAPAWKTLTARLGLSELTRPPDVAAFAQMAVELPRELQEEYGSKYIICAGGSVKEPDGSIYTGVSSPEGTKLWLVKRDEKGLIDGIDQLTKQIVQRCSGRRPVAVFQADCALRGKLFFNRILKDETVSRAQYPLCKDENVPWLGMYGGGELTPLGGRNRMHYFTTSLYVIVEREK